MEGWRVEVKPEELFCFGSAPDGRRRHLSQVSLGGTLQRQRRPGDYVSVFVDIGGGLSLLVGTLSAAKPVVVVSPCLRMEEGFRLLHDGPDATVCFDGHSFDQEAGDAAATSSGADVATELDAEQEEDVGLDVVNSEEVYDGEMVVLDDSSDDESDDDDNEVLVCRQKTAESSGMAALPAPERPTSGPARFASVDNAAGYLRVAANAESITGGRQVIVLYRHSLFSPARDGQGVACKKTRFYRLRFLLPEAGDLATALPWISASLCTLLCPNNGSKQLDALWSSMVAGDSLPPQTSPCLQITANVGVLHERHSSPENMARMQSALHAILEEEWPGYHKDVEVRLPAVVRHEEEAAAEPDEPRAAKRRKIAESEECSICLDEFERGSSFAQMRCSHGFHESCLLDWLKESLVCPLCRYEMASSVNSQ